MVKSLKKGPWLINYEVHSRKVVLLLYSSKGFEPRGWLTYGGEEDDRFARGS